MELEAIRMLATGAADETIGVNAMLDGLPLDGTDQRPTHLTIYSSVDSGPIARRKIAAEGSGLTFPALAIYVADAATLEKVGTVVRDGEFPIAFSHLEPESDSAAGNRDACYSMRAVLRFLTRFADPSNAALRLRGGVQLIAPIDFKLWPVFLKWDAGRVASTLITTWKVRDTTAYGT